MSASITAFLFIGIIVLALAVIAIVVWVALLSGRIKRLSDRILYDATAQPAPRPSIQMTQPHTAVSASATGPSAPIGNSGPLGNSGAMGITEAFTPQPAVQPMHAQAPMPAQEPARPLVQPGQQTVRSVQPAVARVRTNAVQPMEEQDDGQSFFDSYRAKSEAQQTGSFGREKPTIPFGEDRNEALKRESYYTKDAVDTEYDPDSIDFSRVAGYRNIRR